MTKNKLRDDALAYHAQGRPGKIEVVPTKPYSSQRDLSWPTLRSCRTLPGN